MRGWVSRVRWWVTAREFDGRFHRGTFFTRCAEAYVHATSVQKSFLTFFSEILGF